jgi:hypothetical protein
VVHLNVILFVRVQLLGTCGFAQLDVVGARDPAWRVNAMIVGGGPVESCSEKNAKDEWS